MKNKKGVSNVVSVVLIILVALVAVSILSVFIYNFAKSPGLSPQLTCFELDSARPIKITDVCYNQDSEELEVSLVRIGDNLEFENIYFLSTNEGETERWCCGGDCDECQILNKGSKKYYLDASGLGREKLDKIVLTGFDCSLDERKIENC